MGNIADKRRVIAVSMGCDPMKLPCLCDRCLDSPAIYFIPAEVLKAIQKEEDNGN